MATHSSILAWRISWTRSLGGYGPWGHKESDRTEQLVHFSLSSAPLFCFHLDSCFMGLLCTFQCGLPFVFLCWTHSFPGNLFFFFFFWFTLSLCWNTCSWIPRKLFTVIITRLKFCFSESVFALPLYLVDNLAGVAQRVKESVCNVRDLG